MKLLSERLAEMSTEDAIRERAAVAARCFYHNGVGCVQDIETKRIKPTYEPKGLRCLFVSDEMHDANDDIEQIKAR